jgi:hypothetical protein
MRHRIGLWLQSAGTLSCLGKGRTRKRLTLDRENSAMPSCYGSGLLCSVTAGRPPPALRLAHSRLGTCPLVDRVGVFLQCGGGYKADKTRRVAHLTRAKPPDETGATVKVGCFVLPLLAEYVAVLLSYEWNTEACACSGGQPPRHKG